MAILGFSVVLIEQVRVPTVIQRAITHSRCDTSKYAIVAQLKMNSLQRNLTVTGSLFPRMSAMLNDEAIHLSGEQIQSPYREVTTPTRNVTVNLNMEASSATHVQLLYMDQHIVAVSKPPDMLMHRNTSLDRHAKVFCKTEAEKLVRQFISNGVEAKDHRSEQVDQNFGGEDSENLTALEEENLKYGGNQAENTTLSEPWQLFPVHRLDRATSGIVVFARTSETARKLQESINSPESEKYYIAMARGVTEEVWENQNPLTDHDSKDKKRRHAHTGFQRLMAFPQTGCSLIRCKLYTGRRHQIRRHLSNSKHQILGDTSYGKGRINSYFRETFQLPRMFLHAKRMCFAHPETGERIMIECPVAQDLQTFLYKLPEFNPDLHANMCDLR